MVFLRVVEYANSLVLCVIFIPVFRLLPHLISYTADHVSSTHHSRHPSLPRSVTRDLAPARVTNLSVPIAFCSSFSSLFLYCGFDAINQASYSRTVYFYNQTSLLSFTSILR